MATVMNEQTTSTIGLLIVFGDLISNQQRDECLVYLQKALKRIDSNRFNHINEFCNQLINPNEFQPDAQYRQINNTENGSMAGFLYLPNFHTVINVLKDYFKSCSHVSFLFCGQQIDSNGGLILSDSIFTAEHLHNLLEDRSNLIVENLQIILPFLSLQWTRLIKQKQIKSIEIEDHLSKEINEENTFANQFYQILVDLLTKPTINFDIYSKLIPRDSSGTIAFDEANLYILYGQQGEASLFGIRGFVTLINGGFSRIPSYWNLIRGLQTIDACILTHFDYDVLPGLQTLLHRKTIPLNEQGKLCKPDIGAIFLNQSQRSKLKSSSNSSNNKLLNNLSQNIDQLLHDIKQLNIETYDLIRTTAVNKPNIEPINLYKKIAFGSLDLYVLFPTSLATEDEKIVSIIQKIPIRDQQPSPSIIPLHHWYSSCNLLVWSPTSKSTKENLVRILYTGACPQTLVFEALGRARHLEFLHESQQQTIRIGSTKSTGSINVKPKATPTGSNGEINKGSLRSTNVKAKSMGKKVVDKEKKKNDESIKRPDSISFNSNSNEPFVESNTTTPLEELNSHLISTDPMTASFVDGTPNSRNPFFDKNDDLEIVHHNLSSSTKTLMPSIDEINPQNLPMNDEQTNKKLPVKKSSAPAIVRKSKAGTPSGPIFYVDVAYIPYHGNEHYVDSEFFRRIRARYYVLNAVEIYRSTLESLIEGKQQWEKDQLPVTLVPTFDGDQLRQFFVFNKTRLAELNINIIPASTRCNVQYDDEGSPAQRLRFSNEQ